MSFENLRLNKQLLNAIAELGYKNPTEIQQKCIPQVISGQDIIGIAQTGTGKTAAFLIPLLMMTKFRQPKGPRVLILEPTRELSIQVGEACSHLSKYLDLDFIAVYGGIGPKIQIEKVKEGIDILIATPGRLMDIYRSGALDTKYIKHIVIDEADRMLDMGFIGQIHKILEITPQKTQNMIFSATIAPKVKVLADDFLKFPVEIEVTPTSTPAKTIDQIVYHIPNLRSKISMLEYLYKTEDLRKAIIFTRTKSTADNIFKFLERKIDKNVRVIHSNKGQNTRINAINALKNGDIRILVSTDVTARGIDITEVSHVINFDTPVNYEDYVHRIGRTGRAFKVGKAITLADDAEKMHLEEIEKLIKMPIPVEQVPADVKFYKTPFEEQQRIDREIDHLKRKRNPNFQGAFHTKKRRKK